MAYEELLAGADWKLAPVEFGGPRVVEGERPFVACDVGLCLDSLLFKHWAALPAHPNVIEAVAEPASRRALVRFAAIDWKRTPISQSGQLSTWAEQLAIAFTVIADGVPSEHLGRFARPSVHIDLGGAVRVAFLPCARGLGDEEWPPELKRTWPRAHPASLVYVIAAALAGLAQDITQFADTRFGKILGRCADPNPSARPPSPSALWHELQDVRIGPGAEVRRGPALVGWKYFEEGLGWLATEQHARAASAFDNALEHGTQMRLAQVGWTISRAALGQRELLWESRAHKPNRCAELTHTAREAWNAMTGRREELARNSVQLVPWPDVIECGAALEAERGFAEAVEQYLRAAEHPDRNVALARCYLAMADHRWAVDFASRALAAEPLRTDAKLLRARARLARREPEAALGDVEALLVALPDDGLVHYLRGRCMLALGRPSDARDAFDRACQLSPKLLEAMLLRRQTVRSANAARDATGIPLAQSLIIPEHLADLRASIAAGDVTAALTRLADDAYAADPHAQLALGHCLAYAGRGDDALVAFARALARYDDLLAAAPDDAALIDGRGRALVELCRVDAA